MYSNITVTVSDIRQWKVNITSVLPLQANKFSTLKIAWYQFLLCVLEVCQHNLS